MNFVSVPVPTIPEGCESCLQIFSWIQFVLHCSSNKSLQLNHLLTWSMCRGMVVIFMEVYQRVSVTACRPSLSQSHHITTYHNGKLYSGALVFHESDKWFSELRKQSDIPRTSLIHTAAVFLDDMVIYFKRFKTKLQDPSRSLGMHRTLNPVSRHHKKAL